MYYLLTASFKHQETKLVEMICRHAAVEKIYLLGSTLTQCRTESVFIPDAPSRSKLSHYAVLVLVNKKSSLPLHDLQDRIENSCRPFIPVTAMLMHLELFIDWLQQGKPFAATIAERAVLVYNRDEIPLPPPGTLPENENKDDSLLVRQQEMVTAFIHGAALYIQQKQYHIAMFMLHQAAEHALHVLLKKHMHWYCNTHNIDKLLRYAALVCYQVPGIFNHDNEEEQILLKLLQDAYSGSRYKEDYQVPAGAVTKVLEKIKRLQQLTILPV